MKEWICREMSTSTSPNENGILMIEKELIRCKDCKHRFEGEKYPNCCEVLMEMSQWLVEISVKDEWHCGSGERKKE